jgi:hypothetical protein
LRDQIIQFYAESLLHLISRAIREGDRNYLVDTDVVCSEDVEIALHEHCCFTGARARCNRNMSVQCVRSFFLLRLQLAVANGRGYDGRPATNYLRLRRDFTHSLRYLILSH